MQTQGRPAAVCANTLPEEPEPVPIFTVILVSFVVAIFAMQSIGQPVIHSPQRWHNFKSKSDPSSHYSS